MSIEEQLRRIGPEQYGERYNEHMLEIYKLYVTMADNISARRQSANSFFLSVNTAVIAVVSYMHFGLAPNKSSSFLWLIGIAGMAICFMWYRLVRSYKDLNSGKFKVVHCIEQHLPIAPYDAEWEAVGRGKNPKLYLPFTHIEQFVPWVFFLLHCVVLVRALSWQAILGIITKTS